MFVQFIVHAHVCSPAARIPRLCLVHSTCNTSAMTSSSSQRFIPENPDNLRQSKYSKKTEYTTGYAKRLLSQFLESRNLTIKNLDSSSLNTELCLFYAYLRKEDGGEMTSSSITNIRYALARHIKSTLCVDILKDPDFTRSNEVFSGKLAKLKRDGKGATTHFDVIVDDDLKKIASLSTDEPDSLQMKCWFTIQLHFAQRGAENTHAMTKSDLIFTKNHQGRTQIQLRDFMTKNHRETDSSKSTQALIVEMDDEDCPVTLLKDYLGRLHESNPYLWQAPNKRFKETGRWYNNAKLGENSISRMMSNISAACNLSKRYTNHCVRATSITVLGRNYQDNDIRAISGHKSLNALGIYKRTSTSTLESMSSSLHQTLFQPALDTIVNAVVSKSSAPVANVVGSASNCAIADVVASERPAAADEIALKCSSTAARSSTDEHHNQCCLSLGYDESYGLLADAEWDNLLQMCHEEEKKSALSSAIANAVVPESSSAISNVATSNLSSFASCAVHQSSINQKAVKKGNKFFIFNNCSGSFQF